MRCGGELKTALVAQLVGVTPDEARSRLQAVGGQVLPLGGPTENGMMGMRVVVPKQVNFTKLMDLLFESFVSF